MIEVRDRVILTQDIPEHGLKTGDVGHVLRVPNQGEVYEIRFAALSGRPIADLTLSPEQFRQPRPREIETARPLADIPR